MKKPTLVSIALLGISASIGLSCGSNKNNAASTTETGGQGTGATAGTGTGAGGSGLAGTGTGGAGGAANGIPVTNGYLTQGSLKGTVFTLVDTGGSSISRTPDAMCASGTTVQYFVTDAGLPAWGAALGWNLNQEMTDAGAGAANGADLSAFTKIAVGLSGATGRSMGVSMEVMSAEGGSRLQYCADLSTTGTPSDGVLLSSLTLDCWNPGGTPFDPQTIRPYNVWVNPQPDLNEASPFDFCITRLEFLP